MEVARAEVRADELVRAAGLCGDHLRDGVDWQAGRISNPRVHAESGRADGIARIAGSIDRALRVTDRKLWPGWGHGARVGRGDRLAWISCARTIEELQFHGHGADER